MGEKRKYIIIFTSLFILLIGLVVVRNHKKTVGLFKEDGIKYAYKTQGKDFMIYNNNNNWEKRFIKGVNIGATSPGYFPGEFGTTKGEYLRWFKYIGEMNGNSIRVYTILKPEFYEAFYEYNKNAEKPLYLFQGVWVNEEDIARVNDAHNPKIKDEFKKDIKTIIDIIHGKGKIEERKGYASGEYKSDISPYVAGWILGIEWDPYFVKNTNEKNSNKKEYSGKYLYTEGSSPFESFLCESGDLAVEYETQKYKTQRPVSFTNWLTTDSLEHPNEPYENEDMVEVNTEHIKNKSSFKPGLFASYHVYPYYPDFLIYDKKYRDFKDEDGKINNYRAYLKDLIKQHSVPVIVAEFGVPASRGKTHENSLMDFNQGNNSEKRQGEVDAFMLKNIYEEDYAGALLFTWQDEWFKRTWNTMDLDMPDRRPYWSNTQTNEQQFGLLAFEPGEKAKCYVDGEIQDWKDKKPIYRDEEQELYINSDEKYVYFMVKSEKIKEKERKIIIPIDVNSKSGNKTYNNEKLNFNRDVDFLITINGKENSKILVDAYYDSFYYLYSKRLKMIPENKQYENKNSGIFNPMCLCLSREIYLPQEKVKVPFKKYETGKLIYGIGNPESKEYNSLADYYTKGQVLEIRIPWQLLNVMDPSTKNIMDDLYEQGDIKPIKTEGIYAGVRVKTHSDNSAKNVENIDMKHYSWKEWDKPYYHERLKKSYYILKDVFKDMGK